MWVHAVTDYDYFKKMRSNFDQLDENLDAQGWK